jgi:hypothetical protein
MTSNRTFDEYSEPSLVFKKIFFYPFGQWENLLTMQVCEIDSRNFGNLWWSIEHLRIISNTLMDRQSYQIAESLIMSILCLLRPFVVATQEFTYFSIIIGFQIAFRYHIWSISSSYFHKNGQAFELQFNIDYVVSSIYGTFLFKM